MGELPRPPFKPNKHIEPKVVAIPGVVIVFQVALPETAASL